MIRLDPTTLEGHGVRLEPMVAGHAADLATAATDGRLWDLWFTSVPSPEKFSDHIAMALAGQAEGHMLPWVVRELATDKIVGSTRYHDIVASIDRINCSERLGERLFDIRFYGLPANLNGIYQLDMPSILPITFK